MYSKGGGKGDSSMERISQDEYEIYGEGTITEQRLETLYFVCKVNQSLLTKAGKMGGTTFIKHSMSHEC